MCARRWLVLASTVLSVAINAAAAAAATDTLQPRSALGTDRSARASISPSALVAAIVDAKTLREAVAATQTALATGGIAVMAGPQVVVAAAQPAAASTATPLEALNMALELRGRRSFEVTRMSLAELAQMLRDFGFPFHDRTRPEFQLASTLRRWKTNLGTTADPVDFAVLFVAAMAKRQRPPLDIGKRFEARDLRLSSLEVRLLTAAFQRIPPENLRPVMNAHQIPALVTRPAAPPIGDCSALEALVDTWVGLPDGISHLALQELVGRGLEVVLRQYGVGKEPANKAVSRILAATQIATRIEKLIGTYSSVTFRLATETDSIHQPIGRKAYVPFLAIAGVEESNWAEYQAHLKGLKQTYGPLTSWRLALQNCLGEAGIPPWPSTDGGTVADAIDRHRVSWRLVGNPNLALNPHAYNKKHAKGYTGLRGNRLIRASDHKAVAGLYIEVQPEQRRNHPGHVLRQPIEVRASLDTSGVTEETFGNAVKGILPPPFADIPALGAALADLAAGWFEATFQLEAWEQLFIEFHRPFAPGRAEVTITGETRFTETDSYENWRPLGCVKWSHAERYTYTTSVSTKTPGIFLIQGKQLYGGPPDPIVTTLTTNGSHESWRRDDQPCGHIPWQEDLKCAASGKTTGGAKVWLEGDTMHVRVSPPVAAGTCTTTTTFRTTETETARWTPGFPFLDTESGAFFDLEPMAFSADDLIYCHPGRPLRANRQATWTEHRPGGYAHGEWIETTYSVYLGVTVKRVGECP